MNPGNALKEVWEWKEKVGKDIIKMNKEKEKKYFNSIGEKYSKKLGLKIIKNKKVEA